MYLEHFGLKKSPFQITPDTDFLFLSRSHARAKAYMSYSIWKWDGFSVVTGKPGTGKTLMIRNLIERLDRDVEVVYLNHTRLTRTEFLRSVAANLGMAAFDAGEAELIARITEHLEARGREGRRVLLIVDEAHYLKPAVMEEIRFFTALENDGKPLLNLILVGDDSLLAKFDKPGMEQLRQRVRLWYSIGNLDKEGVKEYINYRLASAGRVGEGIFTDSAISLIYSFTDGLPRLINILCDAALVAAYVKEDQVVSTSSVRTALDELQWDKFTGKTVLEHKVKAGALAHRAEESGRQFSDPKLRISRQGILMAELIMDQDKVTIGRAESSDIMLDDPFVCDHHAVIRNTADGYVVEDLGSLNGTYVNARKTRHHKLASGDIIGIASYQIKISFETGGEEIAEAPDILEDASVDFDVTTIVNMGRMAG